VRSTVTALLNRLIKPFRITVRESRANIDGLNIVFGAVLGFVLASTETMGTRDFAMTLFYSATLAIIILYVSHSKHRLIYALIAIGVVAALPFLLVENFVSSASRVPEKLQPTFAVWLVMTLMMEFWPREQDAVAKTGEEEAEI
jgi:cell division protein FtsW (lipid II flippase)